MSDEFRICCNLLHVKTATWIIAIVHLIECGLTLVSGALYFSGITDGSSRHSQSMFSHLNTGGTGWAQRYGFGGLMLAALIWLLFICFLIYGLRKNRAFYVLLHLIYSVGGLPCYWSGVCCRVVLQAVIFALFVLATVASLIEGRTLGNITWFILFAIVLFLLLYVEYKCYQFLKYSYVVAVVQHG